jgi:phospholipase A-2-activating protein
MTLLSSQQIASCGAGGEIRVWDLAGSCLQTLNGHDGKMVYSIAALPGASGTGFVTAGGDGRVWVWADGVCVQKIELPCTDALMVDAAPNGDIVVGCPDGTARVFSTNPERQMASEEIITYKHGVAAALSQLQEAAAAGGQDSGMVGDLDTNDIQGPEALEKPGKDNGQVVMVKKGGKIEAHEWSEAEGKWQYIGVVSDAKEEQEQPPPGWQYFDIKLNGATLRAKHKIGDNPYMTAQKFIHANDLEQFFLDEVAEFITENTEAKDLGGAVGNVDPFTGGSAYRPSTNTAQHVPTGPLRSRDPFTGGSAYVPDYAKPFTGGKPSAVAAAAAQHAVAARDGPAAAAAAGGDGAAAAVALFPVTQYVTFKAVKVAGLLKKIAEFNAVVPVPVQFNPEELQALSVQLEAITTEGVDVDPRLVCPELRKLLQWPAAQRFPAVDALRLALLRPNLRADLLEGGGDADVVMNGSAAAAAAGGGSLLNQCLEMAGLVGQPSSAPGPAVMLSLRCLANAFDDSGTMLRNGVPDKLIDGMDADRIIQMKASEVLATTTVVLNLAIALAKQGVSGDADVVIKSKCLAVLTVIFAAGVTKTDAEIEYRALLAIGTLVAASVGPLVAGLVPSVKGASTSTDPRSAAAAAHILQMQ